MCGINGFSFTDPERIQRMNASIKHRGPDDDGFFIGDGMTLGHTRLSILDLSPAGHQPMYTEDENFVLVFNGEIYNFQEIRSELEKKGYHFRSQTDSEVILYAYAAYGEDCVKRFNGIFAFAIWDKKQERLFLARDHVGVKPLYYFWDEKQFIFSSEIKAILTHPIERRLNMTAMNIYFRMLYVPAPMTMFENIFSLEPGTYLTYQKGIIEQRRYWHPSLERMTGSYSDGVAAIRSCMKDAVKRQLVADRPVGVFLSGGIDSTAVLGVTRETLGRNIQTFSVGFDIAPEKFNADLRLAKQTSRVFETDHHELLITGEDCRVHIEDVIYHMDTPVSNATQIATYLLSKYARKNIVVALGGDGGDELFGGYERYRLSRLVSLYRQTPEIVRQPLSSILIRGFAHRYPQIKKITTAPGVERYMSFMAQKEEMIARILKNVHNNTTITKSFFTDHYFLNPSPDAEKDFMWADIRSWLPDESLVRSDKMSMAAGLEQRVPILDYRMIELSLRIPTSWKLRGMQTKAIFKDAMRPYVPAHVFGQPKRGWFSPGSVWLRTSLQPLMREALSPSYNPGTADIFDFDEIERMIDDHVDARAYHLNLLWALLTFQLWYHRYFTVSK